MRAEIQNWYPMNIYVTPPSIACIIKKKKKKTKHIHELQYIEELLVFLHPVH